MKEEVKNKKGRTIKRILIGSGVGLGLLGLGLGWWYFFGRKNQKVDEETENDLIQKSTLPDISKPTSSQPRTIPGATQQKDKTNSFPLKYGDKGTLVKQFQEGLIRLYGKGILPNYGADGDFKKEMAAALRSKGLAPAIDKETFDRIVAAKPSATTTTASKNLILKEGVDIAKNIWLNAALKKNDGMVSQLQRIRSVQEYKMVDALMKTVGQRQPIAEIALIAATDDTGRQLIVDEFKRIGLKYKEEKWTVAGFEPRQIITNYPTVIRDRSGLGINVPEDTLLGEIVSGFGPVTTFRTIDDQILYVPTKDISHV